RPRSTGRSEMLPIRQIGIPYATGCSHFFIRGASHLVPSNSLEFHFVKKFGRSPAVRDRQARHVSSSRLVLDRGGFGIAFRFREKNSSAPCSAGLRSLRAAREQAFLHVAASATQLGDRHVHPSQTLDS